MSVENNKPNLCPLKPGYREEIEIQGSAAGHSKDLEKAKNIPDPDASGSVPVSNRHQSDQSETSMYPSLEYRSTEDDELGDEVSSDHFPKDYMQENELEQEDQDFRDGENHGTEDQDDFDELRNGK